MRPVKPALAASLIFLLLASGCPRERHGSAPESVDECRYTLLRPERQRLRVWDGRFLDEDGRGCFGRSHCLTGGERTRVHRSAADTLAIEVGDARYERPLPERLSRRQTHHSGLAHAIAGDDVVALLHARELEVFTAAGGERFPFPTLHEGERLALPVLAGGGVGFVLAPDTASSELPVRPFLWLREPAKHPQAVSSEGRPLLLRGETVGRLFRANDGWRVRLASGFAALAAPPHPTPPDVTVGDGGAELYVHHKRHLRVLGPGGAAFALDLEERDVLTVAADRLYLLAPGRGVERLSPKGRALLHERMEGADLAGRRLPKGAYVERVQASGDETRLAVIERVRFPGCRVEDRVHVLDLRTTTLQTLAEGEAVRLHPRFARGRLHFVEAEVRYDAVAGL